MQNIPGLNDGDDNQGGLRFLLFLPIDELESIPIPDTNGVVDLETFVENQDVEFFYCQFTLDSARFKEDEETSGNGPYYKQLIEAAVPKDYSFRRKQFTDMENYEYLVVGIGNTGKAFMVGEIDEDGNKSGMRLKKKFDTQDKFKDHTSYTLQFYKESKQCAIAVINVSFLDLSTAVPVDNGISNIGLVEIGGFPSG